MRRPVSTTPATIARKTTAPKMPATTTRTASGSAGGHTEQPDVFDRLRHRQTAVHPDQNRAGADVIFDSPARGPEGTTEDQHARADRESFVRSSVRPARRLNLRRAGINGGHGIR